MTVEFQFRVLYADTDAMGQVYYGTYLKWFEIGRSEWFRRCGMSYRELEGRGVYLPVVEAHCRYRNPAYYDDLLTVATDFRYAGPARLQFDYAIKRSDDAALLAEGYTVHVCTTHERKILKPPTFLKELIRSSDTGGGFSA